MTTRHQVAVVEIKVKDGCVDEFISVIRKNAQCSRKEPGVISFDVMQKKESPREFLLVEVYKDADAQSAHRNTAHYLEFREKAASLLPEPYGVNIYGIIPDFEEEKK